MFMTAMLHLVFIFASFFKTNNKVTISVFMFGNLRYTLYLKTLRGFFLLNLYVNNKQSCV